MAKMVVILEAEMRNEVKCIECGAMMEEVGKKSWACPKCGVTAQWFEDLRVAVSVANDHKLKR